MPQRDKGHSVPTVDVKLFISPREVTDDDVRGCSVVVIDVLRASTTIAAALMNGAREVIPVLTPAEGGKLAGPAGRGISLLCGEREGRKIDGFDLGNSPLEYTAEKVGGRIIIFSSTNGAPAILRARAADRVYVGSFANFGAVAKRLIEDRKPVAIICAGKEDQFAIEDFVCGGKFVNSLEARHKRGLQVTDAARAAALLHRHFDGGIPSLLKSSNHGKYLSSLGFDADLELCARMDTYPVVPMFVEGKIKGYKPDGSPLNESAANAA
jgi:2-phosphosulfolactate phosphatase